MNAPARGYTLTKDDYAARLHRIEGQVRGIGRMVDEGAYCVDVLTQVGAVVGGLQSVAVGLLDEHIRHCVRNAVAEGDEVTLETMVSEATAAVERLVKT